MVPVLARKEKPTSAMKAMVAPRRRAFFECGASLPAATPAPVRHCARAPTAPGAAVSSPGSAAARPGSWRYSGPGTAAKSVAAPGPWSRARSQSQQLAVSKPAACAPCCKRAKTCCHCATVRYGLRPDLGRLDNPARPWVASCLAQWLTALGLTPKRRAISACDKWPVSKSCAAARRRSSFCCIVSLLGCHT